MAKAPMGDAARPAAVPFADNAVCAKRPGDFADAPVAAPLYRSRCVNGAVIRGWGAEAAVMLAIALLMAALGPFGSWTLPFGTRVIDWLLFAGGGYCCFRPVIAIADLLARYTRCPRIAALVLAGLIAAVPTTLLVAWALGGMDVADLRVGTLAARYPQVALLGLLVTGVQVAVAGRRAPPVPDPPVSGLSAPEPPVPEPASDPAVPPASSSPAPAPTAAFLDRLPPALGRDLLALEQEDHYLRAHTALGSTLFLMRMRDAVAQLAAVDGARVHRSWWVARAAVATVERRERAVALRLSNGLIVPVARAIAPELRAAGWW